MAEETILFDTGEPEKTPRELLEGALENVDNIREIIIITMDKTTGKIVDDKLNFSFTPMDVYRFLGMMDEAKTEGRMFWVDT